MPARTDHDRRDAQHAARARIAVQMSRYIRRLTEESYAHLEERAASHDGISHVDWSEAGTAAADKALASYGIIAPRAAIAAATSSETNRELDT